MRRLEGEMIPMRATTQEKSDAPKIEKNTNDKRPPLTLEINFGDPNTKASYSTADHKIKIEGELYPNDVRFLAWMIDSAKKYHATRQLPFD